MSLSRKMSVSVSVSASVFVLVAAVALAGCGDDGESSSRTSTSSDVEGSDVEGADGVDGGGLAGEVRALMERCEAQADSVAGGGYASCASNVPGDEVGAAAKDICSELLARLYNDEDGYLVFLGTVDGAGGDPHQPGLGCKGRPPMDDYFYVVTPPSFDVSCVVADCRVEPVGRGLSVSSGTGFYLAANSGWAVDFTKQADTPEADILEFLRYMNDALS